MVDSYFSNENVMKYALMDRCQSREELLPYFKEVLKNNTAVEKRKAYEYGVYLTADDTFIGFADIEVYISNSYGGCGEIGYFFLPQFWGHGYAAEAARMLLEISFNHIRLHRVCASCNSNNVNSEKIMQKIGMKKEGEFRKVRFKDGHWDNELRYSILAEEWKVEKTIKL